MRKLNRSNKIAISSLIVIIALVCIAIGIFINYKIGEMSLKYDVPAYSYVYNKNKELKYLEKSSYVKKSFNGNYILVYEDEDINLGTNNIIYLKESNALILLGKFYEVKEGGTIVKYNGITIINSEVPSFYKISDRMYLFVGNKIVSSSSNLVLTDYVQVNIDKKGNAYLFNNSINTKTFNELDLTSGDMVFHVNEEVLTIDDEDIQLDKINGSTNEYVKKEDNEDEEGQGGGGGGNGDTIYPERPVIIDKVTENKYVQHKTSVILPYHASINSVVIDYIAYDPFTEYSGLYLMLYQGNKFIKTVDMDIESTQVTINDLRVATEYKAQFYYTYIDDDNHEQKVLFDTIYFKTSEITGNISLDKISGNSVSFKLVINDKALLNEGKVVAYDSSGHILGTTKIEPNAAISGGFRGTILFNDDPEGYVTLALDDCVYNDVPVNIDASYKYKV